MKQVNQLQNPKINQINTLDEKLDFEYHIQMNIIFF